MFCFIIKMHLLLEFNFCLLIYFFFENKQEIYRKFVEVMSWIVVNYPRKRTYKQNRFNLKKQNLHGWVLQQRAQR